MTRPASPLLALALALAACGDDAAPPATVVAFDLDGRVDTPATYWDHPFPSDLRLLADGRPDLAAFPNPRQAPILTDLLSVARDRRGFPVMPVAYFRFSGPLAPRGHTDVLPAAATAPILIVDIDPASPERGRLFATVAQTFIVDDFVPEHVLGVAPRPGLVLAGGRRYAVVVRRGANDAAGAPLGVAPGIAALARGEVPAGAWGQRAADLYAPLWPVLADLGVPAGDVAAATVFTTADAVADLHAMSEGVRGAHAAVIADLAVDPDDGAAHDGYCELVGTVTFPQFQTGAPPFDSDGRFELGTDGLPLRQRDETVPLAITLPAGEMPAAGWPLYQFFHGSGGVSGGVVDLGPIPAIGAEPVAGEGPGFVVARHGIAAASSALPVNPERLPGASDYEYLNINNLAALPFTFQQGVLEQRLLLDALLALEIPPALVAACAGVSLPAGAAAHRFDPGKLVAGGQSMGGMYTNMIGAVEPRFGALVPTGAGGFWNLMILETAFVPGADTLLAAVLDTPIDELTFLHPGMHLIGLAWEGSEPMAFMPRVARRPLDGHPARHVYEPIGKDDEYFPMAIFDAAALAYGNQQVGPEAWPETQEALAQDGLDGLASYPVTANRESAEGAAYTGVVVQYEGDGIVNSHYLYRQSEEVKHQYGCFLASYLATGVATVPPPASLATPCP